MKNTTLKIDNFFTEVYVVFSSVIEKPVFCEVPRGKSDWRAFLCYAKLSSLLRDCAKRVLTLEPGFDYSENNGRGNLAFLFFGANDD